MNSRVAARLEHVKRTSRSARRVCFWLMAFVTLMSIVMVPGTLAPWACEVRGLPQPCEALPPQAVALTLVAFGGGLALLLTALYRLARLFGNYARGEIFTRASVRELRLVGYVAVAYAIFQLVLFVAGLAMVAGGVVESPARLPVDLPIGSVVVAGFILLLSWVMDVGAELREENELTV